MVDHFTTIVSSETKAVRINRSLPTVIIGERINPTGRKKLQEELMEGKFDMVRRDAKAQVSAGAAILDINAGVPGADEPALLVEMIMAVSDETDAPLCIDTANVQAMEAALKIYKGKALVNSVNGEENKLEAILPLIKEYGAAVIGLTLDDDGIPTSVDKRLAITEKIIERATKIGVPIEDIVIDPLAMSMGADQNAGRLALDSIQAIVANFGVNITMGCSNISFGIPDREAINAIFLTMAIRCGLTCPITNPFYEQVHMAILGADLCMGRDEFASQWITAYRKRKKTAERD